MNDYRTQNVRGYKMILASILLLAMASPSMAQASTTPAKDSTSSELSSQQDSIQATRERLRQDSIMWEKQLAAVTIKEVKVIHHPGAEYGNNVGCVLLITTKKNLEGLAIVEKSGVTFDSFVSNNHDLDLTYTHGKMTYYGKLGYEYQSHFCTAFKRKFGISPMEYRLRRGMIVN